MNYPSLTSVHLQTSSGPMTGQPLVLKQGQVIHGTIKQLYPEQMAEVQIGGQRMMAKLEIPLQAGNSHYFQVSGVEPDLQLKVISGPMTPSAPMSQQVSQLLESMQLPQTNEMKELASHLLKNNLPMTKEQMQQAEQIMKTLPEAISSKDALKVIQKLIELKLPIQQNTFQAVLQGSMKQGFTEVLGNLQQLLLQDDSIPPTLREQLQNQLQMINKPLTLETGGILLAKMLDVLSSSSASPADKLTVLQLLKSAGMMPKSSNLFNWNTAIQPSNNGFLQQLSSASQTGNMKEVSAILQQVKESLQQNSSLLDSEKLGIRQSITKATTQPTIENVQAVTKHLETALQKSPIQMLTAALYTTSKKEITELLPQLKNAIQEQTLLTSTQKEELLQTIQKIDIEKSISPSIQSVVKELHNQLLKAFSDSAQLQPFQEDKQGMTAKQQLMQILNADIADERSTFTKLVQVTTSSKSDFIQNMLMQTEEQLAQQLDGKTFETAIKQTLQNLGLSYEAKLSENSSNLEQISSQLKPQLLGLLQEDSISSTTKNVAEQVVARMNGMQYLSGENGPQHQLIMQVPLEFFGKKTEATLQWNGRMKKDGKIDADYARILFYLQLSSIQETVIDMQVQSRVVSVTIYNENDNLKSLAGPLKSVLKNGLSQHDYQLSGVFIKKYAKEQTNTNSKKTSASELHTQGVDIRI
ncbi:MAG: hypothetical protein ACI383_04785 [Rummeliibacillus sp.]